MVVVGRADDIIKICLGKGRALINSIYYLDNALVVEGATVN